MSTATRNGRAAQAELAPQRRGPHTAFPELWEGLAGEFHPEEVKTIAKGGKAMRYVTARSVMNRLDYVVGPENWWDRYTPGEHSVMCELSIRLPDGQVIAKVDAGAYAGMSDPGDDDKSGFSDALKRAAAKFGVGRYLYGDGTLTYYQSQPPQEPLPARPPRRSLPPEPPPEPEPEAPPPRRPRPVAAPPSPYSEPERLGVRSYVSGRIQAAQQHWEAVCAFERVPHKPLKIHDDQVAYHLVKTWIGVGVLEEADVNNDRGKRDSHKTWKAVSLGWAQDETEVRADIDDYLRSIEQAAAQAAGIVLVDEAQREPVPAEECSDEWEGGRE